MKYWLGIFVVLICFSGLGQLEKPFSGQSYTTARKTNFSGFIGENASTLFAIDYLQINRKKQELNLRRFDRNDLQLIDTKDIYRIIDETYYNEPNEIFFQEDTIYLFSTLNNLKGKHDLVYLEIFNQYGDLISSRAIDTLDRDENYHIAESEEKKGFIIARHNRFDNIFEQSIQLKAINTVGEVDWDATIKSPSTLQSLTIEAVRYSLNAPVYVLCNYGFEVNGGPGARENTDLINTKYALWGYDHESKFMKEFDLRIKSRWINGLEMVFTDDHDLVIGGFMNETRNYSINGVFSLKITPDLQVESSGFYKYKRAFYGKFIDPKHLNKTKELDDIILRDLVLLDDGSYFLLGEHYYQYTERNYDPRTNITTTTENYNYNSIIAAYFDSHGNHQWSERIPKFQHTINDNGYFSSFSIMQWRDEVYLFFNDTERNNELKLDDYFNYKSLFNNRKFQISYVQIGKDGVKGRGPLIGTENNFMLRARQSYQVSPGTFYLYGEVGKSRKLFSVETKQPN